MRTYAAILLIASLLLPAPALAAAADDAYQQARLDYFALRKDEKRKAYRHHWMDVIRRLDRGAARLAGDARCGALFNAGRAWHELSDISYLQDDRAEAIARYRRVADGCPRSNLADDALFHTAELQQKRDADAARKTLDRLLAAHPRGDRVADARALKDALPAPQQKVSQRPHTQVAAAAPKAEPQRATVSPPAAQVAAAPKAEPQRAVASTPAAGSAEPQRANAPAGELATASATVARVGNPQVPPAAAKPSSEPAAARPSPSPAPADAGKTDEPIAGAGLPSAVDILAALDARGADGNRPEDVALAEDLRRDLLARTGAAAAHPPRTEAPASGDDSARAAVAEVRRTENATADAAPRAAAATPAGKTEPRAAPAAGELDRERLAAIEKATGGEIPLSLVAGLKVRRVVIDPGHGGKDTGAIGKRGTREKDLVLSISRKLKRRLEAMGLEVLLTRDRDEFLELEERTRFANDKHADLFISVHVNAAENRRAYGIETYTLNLNSDRYAMRLAARENASSSKSIGDLQFILADLATKANTDDSVRLARLVQGEMVGTLRRSYGSKIRDLGVKQALFFVLVGAKMPAILVEAAFVSNPDEELRLRSDKYQEETARSIADGVRRFIAEREAIAQGRAPGGSNTSGVF